MPFVDRREQLLAEAGRWFKGGTCKIKKMDYWWGILPLITSFLLEGWCDMGRSSLCCSIGLGVVFDPCSHTRYPSYELMSRNWYVSFCWTWYQEKRGPCRSIPNEKNKTIPVPGGVVYLYLKLSPSYASENLPPQKSLLSAKFRIHLCCISQIEIYFGILQECILLLSKSKEAQYQGQNKRVTMLTCMSERNLSSFVSYKKNHGGVWIPYF
jgi:hypothetical protein